MSLLTNTAAKLISKASFGIVIPRPKEQTQETKILRTSRKDPKKEINEHAFLNFISEASVVTAHLKSPYFKYENIEALEMSKLNKEEVLAGLNKIKETGGLPNQARVVVLNRELKGDKEIEAKLKELINEHDFIEHLSIRFGDNELDTTISDSEEAQREAQSRANANYAHIFSVRITNPEAQVGNTKAQATESETGNIETQNTEAQIAKTRAINPEVMTSSQDATNPLANISAQEATNPEANTSAQAITNPEANTSARETINPKANTSAQEATNPIANLNAQVALFTMAHIASNINTNPQSSVASQEAIDPELETQAYTSIDTQSPVQNIERLKPEARLN